MSLNPALMRVSIGRSSLELFEGDASEAENAFSHLFSLVHEARTEAGDPTPPSSNAASKGSMMEHNAQLSGTDRLTRGTHRLKAGDISVERCQRVTRFAFAQGLG